MKATQEAHTPQAQTPCRIDLLGGLRVHHVDEVITRFDGYKTGALLAYLALYSDRLHSREALADLFWSDSLPVAGRNSLKQALSSLRRLLEPAEASGNENVLVTDRMHVRLNPAVVVTDVAEFESALASAARVRDAPESTSRLSFAAERYGGELLPGYYEPWVLAERERLAQAYVGALRQLIGIHEQNQEWVQAIDAAYRMVAAAPLEEDGYRDLIRVLAAAGQPAAAVRQYHELEHRLREGLDEAPSEETHDLVRHLLEEAVVAATARPIRRSVPGVGPKEAAPVAFAADPVLFRERSGQEDTPSSDPVLSSLPVPLTSFVGREEEKSRLAEVLRAPSCRLVTLTGLGGSGKTRLSLHVARAMADTFPAAVCFVPLAGVTEPDDIVGAIAEALGLENSGAAAALPAPERIRRHLLSRQQDPSPRSLLVLDNFEQLAENGAFVVRELLERVPSLTCLVTSRNRLLLAGEHEFPLRPLPTPAHPGTPERLLEFASVQLFVDRARAATLDFQITGQNAEAVARLCHWLEGIPLALELAAARAGVLTPGQMLEQITHRLDFLVSRRRDIADRHRTLRAALDWSYRMLLPDLQEFFSRLSVFRGGWTAEAAEAVTRENDVLDCLEYLRDYSLVLTGEVAGVIRFRFLETLREFAWEQLEETEREQLSQRHADYFLGVFCPAAHAGLLGPEPDPRWLRRLEAEQENIGAALAWRAAACCQEESARDGGSAEADAARARALLEQLRLRQEAEKNTTGAAVSSQ